MKLLYAYDALCGWCYGFAPVIERFQEKYQTELEIEPISGGMVLGERVGPIGEVAPYIKEAYKKVENFSGRKFGEPFLKHTLERGQAIFNSLPPAIALSVFKESLAGDKALLFAGEIQKAIYYQGMEPEYLSGYGNIAAKFGLEGKTFRAKMEQPAYQALAEADFKRCHQLGVQGFPTLIILHQGAYKGIASGCLPFEKLESNYLMLKNQLK